MKNLMLNPISMFIAGLAIGVIYRLLYIHAKFRKYIFTDGNMGVDMHHNSIYSSSKKKAMINVFLFCIGMLITYYASAFLSHGVYSKNLLSSGQSLPAVLLLWSSLHG